MNENQNENQWYLLGDIENLKKELSASNGLKLLDIPNQNILLTYDNHAFGAIHNKCNHMGGPLAKGRLKKGCVECPWHYWQFNHQTGQSISSEASKHFTSTAGAVPSYQLKEENHQLWLDLKQKTNREPAVYNMSGNLSREPVREAGKIRVLGISTTAMDPNYPRFSTSSYLLNQALEQAQNQLDVETQIINLHELNFRHCEGFYSKAERACTWPCSITKIDPTDEMTKLYEALVHWADVVIIATPIRWGGASSLYYKMAERLNSVQNQITIKNKVLIQKKTFGLIVTGGQDNIQAVAGQMLTFFGELGFTAPAFPFVAHSLGWSAEKMEHNMDTVKNSEHLKTECLELVERSVKLAKALIN